MGSATHIRRCLRALAAATALSVTGSITANAADVAGPAGAQSSITPSHSLAPSIAPAPTVWGLADYQRSVQYYVNYYRRAHGLAPVYLQWQINNAAMAHTYDMAKMNKLTHTGSDGSNGGTRIQRAGYYWWMWGENVAVGYSTTSSVVAAWMNSSAHRANILNSRFKYIGVGYVKTSTTVWWTLDLAI